MAKRDVSEEELSSGLKSYGGLGAVGGTPARAVRESPFRDSRSQPKVVEVSRPAEKEAPSAKSKPEGAERNVPATVVPSPRRAEKARIDKGVPGKAGRRVKDIYTERVNVQLSPEMRDEVEWIARELQRARSSKEERFTASTVMRVAIRLIVKRFKFRPDEAPNTEEELFDLVEKLFAKE